MKTTPYLKGNYLYALFNEELGDKDNGSFQRFASCGKYGRGFQLVCSGKQDSWVGHLDLEYMHHELDCRISKLRSQTKTSGKEICGESLSYPQLSKERVDKSIFPGLLVEVRTLERKTSPAD